MNEHPITHRSPTAIGRRRLLRSMGIAATATTLIERHVPVAVARRNEATPEATPGAGSDATGQEMSDILAVNVLLEPDAALVEAAQALNARLRDDDSAGYPLDATHAPHISVVQRFVPAGDLGAVSEAVGAILDEQQPLGWPLTATSVEYVVLAGRAAVFIVIERTAELERLQQDLISAVAPFTVERGTRASFVPSASFDPGIIDYVETFVPKVTGANFAPHITVGVGQRGVRQPPDGRTIPAHSRPGCRRRHLPARDLRHRREAAVGLDAAANRVIASGRAIPPARGQETVAPGLPRRLHPLAAEGDVRGTLVVEAADVGVAGADDRGGVLQALVDQ
jgi:hypothetical protein